MIEIQCVFSPAPRQVLLMSLRLPVGSLVKDALAQLGQLPEWRALVTGLSADFENHPKQGIWGRLVAPQHALKQGDRLEIYRTLLVDPKMARKQRFKRQGKGRTGLFARRRVGSVAGY